MAESVSEGIISQPAPLLEAERGEVSCSNGHQAGLLHGDGYQDTGGGDGTDSVVSEKSLAHHKNDSGSYDVPPNCLSANSANVEVATRHGAAVSIHVSNGE